ncbi:coiled-coil and C2 domain-containing protein 1B [Brachionichthys hirsutus]|uniref:coiled-coil and C2 domain-containing protein 1B n=1 Tax=Brachionichthys hirsutus TaxID=412623 RepID=UPI0036048424
MFGKKRAPQPKGQGAAAARQLGLFVDLDPEETMMDVDDPDLEAELAAITGNKAATGGRAKRKGKSPLAMEDIARMADDCMKDIDDDEDDGNLEDDEDLLAELQEVVGGEEAEHALTISPPSPTAAETDEPEAVQAKRQEVMRSSAAPGSLEFTLGERIGMYRAALLKAKTAGEASKVRRYDRGLKTLETMLTAVNKGRPVNEADLPPPVATGVPGAASQQPAPPPSPPSPPKPSPVPTALAPSSAPHSSLCAGPTPSAVPSPEEPAGSESPSCEPAANKTLLLERQREYKMAALRAKHEGDLDQARLYLRTSKRFGAAVEASANGRAVDLSGLPPSPGQGGLSAPVNEASSHRTKPVLQPAAAASGPSAPPAPKDVSEALEQRRAKYVEASSQAKANGDDRKARMHDRIAKQYQSAIRAHKAGKAVNFEELPVPPGFPPIPGQKATGAEHGLAAALVAANKLTSTENVEITNDDDDEERGEGSAVPEELKKSTLTCSTADQGRGRPPSPSPDRAAGMLSSTANQQLEFLEGRKRKYMKAALQAKQESNMEQAKACLRAAKGLDPMIEAARCGQTVDMRKVPSPPTDEDEDEDFILVHHCDVQVSEKEEQVYAHLAKILQEQSEKCVTRAKHFTHLGNVKETTKFESLAEGCKKSLEVLKLAQSRGLPPPQHAFEQRSFHTARIFPELSSTDMVVVIVKAMNLPAPSGIQSNDLDAYIKFDFPSPSSEQPQRHRTAVVKNSSSPEYNQSFTLSINRNHRSFKRVVASKGLKLELLHKGGFLRSDKPIGTALVKLDKLESQSEIREIVEVMDGRKHTGGLVEMKVRLREPLSGQDMQTSSERWLSIGQ